MGRQDDLDCQRTGKTVLPTKLSLEPREDLQNFGLTPKACRHSLPPVRAGVHGCGIGIGKIVGTILGKDTDQERGLKAVLHGFEAIGLRLASVRNDELVDREPLRTRNLMRTPNRYGTAAVDLSRLRRGSRR